VTTRNLYQCNKCRRQTSLIARTLFASTHLPLRLWCRAIYHLTETKQRHLQHRVGSSPWSDANYRLEGQRKLKQVMLARGATK
jgi:hypothetical protein